MSTTSHSLLHRVRTHTDHDAWRRFESIYRPLLGSWLRRLGVSGDDAEDLTQEVLVALMRELPRFEHNGQAGAFRAYLRTMTLNRLRDFQRKQSHRPQATGDSGFMERLRELEDPRSSLSEAWEHEHNQHVVASLLRLVQSEFEPTTWQAFLACWDNEEPAAIAQRLGISVHAVYSAKSRVLKRLRQVGEGLIETD